RHLERPLARHRRRASAVGAVRTAHRRPLSVAERGVKRRLLLALAALLLLVVLAAGLVLVRLDTIVQRRLEEGGSALTGTAVRVEVVDIALAAGRATVHNLTVANPPGFTAPHALVLDGVEVQIDLRSVLSDPLVIDAVRIGAPRVVYEVDAQGRSNIDVL